MRRTRIVAGLTALALTAAGIRAGATPVAIDVDNPENGITDIYSATFDGALSPCTAGSPSYCAFFNGQPGPTRALVINPNPTGVIYGVPDGISPVPAAGSYLDLSLDAGHQNVTISGGVIKVPDVSILIQGSTIVNASGAGFVLEPTARTTSLDANGVAEFLVNIAPAVAVDFSTFTVIVQGPFDGSGPGCSGPLCSLIPILTLDMVRYRLLIDYDPTFTSFTASFIGQTANNSLLYATLNSTVPSNIAITDSIPPSTDHLVPFTNVPVGETASATVTVTNGGQGNLTLGAIAVADPLQPPFTLVNDNCSNQILAPASNCTFEVEFQSPSDASFMDSLDVPSDDPDYPTVTVNVTAAMVPDIAVTDTSGSPSDLLVGFQNVLISESADQTVTVTNDGAVDLVIGTVGQADPLALPFTFVTDNCSGQSIAPGASCTITVRFAPEAVAAYMDTFDVPSNDPDEPTVTVNVSGDGGVPEVEPTATGANSGFMALDPVTLLGLGLFGAAARRKGRALH